MACAYCKRSGHNSATCTNPVAEDSPVLFLDEDGLPVGCDRYGSACQCSLCMARVEAIQNRSTIEGRRLLANRTNTINEWI